MSAPSLCVFLSPVLAPEAGLECRCPCRPVRLPQAYLQRLAESALNKCKLSPPPPPNVSWPQHVFIEQKLGTPWMMKMCGAFRHPLFPILPSHRVLLTHQQPENWAIPALKNNAKIKGKARLSKGESTEIQGILEGKLFLTWGKKNKKMFCCVPNRSTHRMM